MPDRTAVGDGGRMTIIARHGTDAGAGLRTDPHLDAARRQAVPLRVLVADDHPLFRRGVARTVQRQAGLELVAEAADGHEALELIDLLQPDVAVLDLRMPRLTGIDVCAELRARPAPPPTRVLILSAFDDAALVWDALTAGASGFVGKQAAPAAVCAAIEAVGRGEAAFGTAPRGAG
jgi:DNA-binding NarL/FixJ family response regulator